MRIVHPVFLYRSSSHQIVDKKITNYNSYAPTPPPPKQPQNRTKSILSNRYARERYIINRDQVPSQQLYFLSNPTADNSPPSHEIQFARKHNKNTNNIKKPQQPTPLKMLLLTTLIALLPLISANPLSARNTAIICDSSFPGCTAKCGSKPCSENPTTDGSLWCC